MRLIFELSADEREKLEQHRARLGLRSMAQVLRRWINQGGPDGASEPVVTPRPRSPTTSVIVRRGSKTSVTVREKEKA